MAMTNDQPKRDQTTPCPCCKNEPERGYIEMPNNGPIVPCWICNFEEWRRDNEHAAIGYRLGRSLVAAGLMEDQG